MIYLLRHGLDDESYIGGYSNLSLTPLGKLQVIKALEFIKSENLNIKSIYSSDILRAYESALIVGECLGIPVIKTSILRELDKGDLNGIKKELANIKYPLFVNPNDINLKYPNGESMKSFYDRIKRDLNEILKEDNCLLVTHRGVINMIYYIFNDICLDMDKEKFDVTHASIHECDPKLRIIKKIY